ncbi:MAG: hypothetical protein Q9168_004959 [Polycauliona sp. 1 TL-2023]
MFAKITDPIIAAIEKQITEFKAKHSPSVINRIFFFGGLSKSLHVRNTLRKHFYDEQVMGYPIEVVLPHASISDVVVAKGAVLKSLRGEIITKRYRRRNFGVVADVTTGTVPNHLRGNAEQVKDIEDNRERLRNRAIWLFQNGEEFNERLVRIYRGWRALPLKGPLRLREYLISSPHELEEYVDILHPPNGVTHAGFLELDLDETDRSRFRIEYNPKTHKPYHRCQYEVRFTVGYLTRHFEIVIPRKGVFPEDWRKKPGSNGDDDDARLGSDVIKKAVRIVRQVDRQDIEDDPQHIFDFQDQELEEHMAWKERFWYTGPRDYKRPSRLRNSLGDTPNIAKTSLDRGDSEEDPISRRHSSQGGIRKKKRIGPSCERCLQSPCKCHISSKKDDRSPCEKSSAGHSIAKRPKKTSPASESSAPTWKAVNGESPGLGPRSTPKLSRPTEEPAPRAPGRVDTKYGSGHFHND